MASALKKFRMLEQQQQQQQDDDPATREPDPKPTKKNKLSMYSHIFSSFESSDTPDEIRRKTIEKVREEKRQAEIRKKEKLEDEKRRREEEIELKRRQKEEEERRQREEEGAGRGEPSPCTWTARPSAPPSAWCRIPSSPSPCL